MKKPTIQWGLASCGAVWACVAIAAVTVAQTRVPSMPPATQPAVIRAQAFAPGDPAIATTQMAQQMQTKLVTLNVTNVPAMTAIDELAKQSGYSIKPGYNGMFRGKGPNISISATQQPFWVVMRDILTRANWSLYSNGGDNSHAIQIAPANYGGGAVRAAASIMGPFFTTVSNIERENTVGMATPQNTTRTIHIQLQSYIEPKIVASEVSYEPMVDEAVDDNGNSMMPAPGPDRRNMQGGRGIGWYGRVSLPYPTTNPGTHIAKLKGHVPARIRMGSEPVEITDPLNAAETAKTVGGKRVTFKSLKKQNNGQYILELVFYRDNQDQQEFWRMTSQGLQLHLTDGQGREASYYNNGGSSDQTSSTQRFGFNNVQAPPVKLIIEVPTGMQEISIPFELVNLPLP
jgi:hypothetical protein